MMPPRAVEMTVSQSNLRNLSASCPHTCAAISVCCKRIAHWKYCRLCKPERKTKWPSSNAPVLRKSARRSSDMQTSMLAGCVSDGALAVTSHGDDFDLDIRPFRQRG